MKARADRQAQFMNETTIAWSLKIGLFDCSDSGPRSQTRSRLAIWSLTRRTRHGGSKQHQALCTRGMHMPRAGRCKVLQRHLCCECEQQRATEKGRLRVRACRVRRVGICVRATPGHGEQFLRRAKTAAAPIPACPTRSQRGGRFIFARSATNWRYTAS